MAFVTDPDNLDRFQVILDPVLELISLKGFDTGTIRHAIDSTGDSDGTTTFTDAGADFSMDGVVAGDILSIISDPGNDGTAAAPIIGHYEVVSAATTTLVVDRNITSSTAADLDYQIAASIAAGGTPENLIDGVTMQALYSFLKEEWRTLSAGLGNAEDLIQFTFPIESITREQFEVGGPTHTDWAFNDFLAISGFAVSRELIRTGGWQERELSGETLRDYAGVVTLGTIDSDAQVYFQQSDDDTDPINFVLVGPVNQAVNTYDLVSPADAVGTGYAFSGTDTLTRNDAGSWITEGYEIGGLITIVDAEDVGNNGTFRILTMTATVLTCESEDGTDQTPFTNNTSDTTMRAAVNKRKFLKLFVRKKARSYATADLSTIGVGTDATDLGVETIVNRFPLSIASDPAIVLDDGQIAADPAAAQVVFAESEIQSTNTNGVIADQGDGTFTFTAAGEDFDQVARTIAIARAGDSLEITSGADIGFYEIVTVDSATQLTCLDEPTTGALTNASTISFNLHIRTLDTGAANATLADVDGDTGTLTSAGSTFDVDTAIGDRQINAGDMVIVTAGTGAVIGAYKVISRDSATVLTLNTEDQIFSGETSQTYEIRGPGMLLQRFESTAVTSDGPVTSIAFADANPDTLTRDAGSWLTDGFVATMALTVVAAEDSGNVGTFIITNSDPTATVVTLIAEEAVTVNTDDTVAGAVGNITGDYGISRTLNGVEYPFHWRLFGNGGSLAQCYQKIQRELRRGSQTRAGASEPSTDIDLSNGVERGDITDLLMTFVSPNGTGLDMFIDDLLGTDANNSTFVDISGDSRNFAFIAGVTINLNQNLLDDGDGGPTSSNRIVVFFTSVPSGDFGTNDAIIVDDSLGADMTFSDQASSPISTTFDYTNNAQGGRTPDTDANITIVAIGLEDAQYVQITGTIAKVNENVFSLVAALERNYQNP